MIRSNQTKRKAQGCSSQDVRCPPLFPDCELNAQAGHRAEAIETSALGLASPDEWLSWAPEVCPRGTSNLLGDPLEKARMGLAFEPPMDRHHGEKLIFLTPTLLAPSHRVKVLLSAGASCPTLSDSLAR